MSLLLVAGALLVCSTAAFNVGVKNANSRPSLLKRHAVVANPWEAEAFAQNVVTLEALNAASGAATSTLQKVSLKSGNSEAQVFALGACVTSFKVDGYDYLFVRPDSKFDGSKPISGGLPICWPQFGPGAIQQHGFARNSLWEVVNQTPSSAVLKLVSDEKTKAIWDKDFELTYSISLSPGKLSTTLTVANTGATEFEFTGAIHSYYRTADVSSISVKGPFKGAKYLDKALKPPAAVVEKNDALTGGAFVERVYYGVSSGLSLEDPVAKKSLKIVNKQGYKDTVVWSPFGDEAMGASKFIGIESANVETPVKVAPGSKWVGQLDLEA